MNKYQKILIFCHLYFSCRSTLQLIITTLLNMAPFGFQTQNPLLLDSSDIEHMLWDYGDSNSLCTSSRIFFEARI